MPFLDFVEECHADSTSWERADPDAALIERCGPTTYRVMLPGGNVHECDYGTERGGHVGSCDCRGFQYRDDDASPCAHLCTLRQAEFIGDDADDGQPVEAVDTISEIDRDADAVEPELRADGGRAAGADQEVFGRPSQRR
jgi:hypothetical protein